jgi:tetraacyldisaccharide 4'-kinase
MNAEQREAFAAKLKLHHGQPVFFTCYHYGNLVPVFEGKAPAIQLQTEKKDNPAVLLITGIADSSPLKKHLDQVLTIGGEMHFPDHHFYSAADIRTMEKRFMELHAEKKIILTTEKDAAKLRELAGEFERIGTSLYSVPVEVMFMDEGEKRFDETVMKFCQG